MIQERSQRFKASEFSGSSLINGCEWSLPSGGVSCLRGGPLGVSGCFSSCDIAAFSWGTCWKTCLPTSLPPLGLQVKSAGAQCQTRAQIPALPSTICVTFGMLPDSGPVSSSAKNGAKCTDFSGLQRLPKGVPARGCPSLAGAKCAVGVSQHFLPPVSQWELVGILPSHK